MFTSSESRAITLTSFHINIIELLQNDPQVFKETPYGDSVYMQMIQKGQYNELIEGINNGSLKPLRIKDLCRFTFTQMAMLGGANPQQLQAIQDIEYKYGINLQSRSVNGQLNAAMMAANLVNLDELKVIVGKCGSFGKWVLETESNSRNVTHCLFLPSLTKGKPSAESIFALAQYLQENGANFLVEDNFGNTAMDYANLFYPEVDLSLLNLPKSSKQLNANNILDCWGETPVQYAVLQGNAAKLQDLLKQDATCRANSTQQTPLHSICCTTNLKDPQAQLLIAQELMEVEKADKAPMNQSDINGFYPIHNAVSFGLLNIFNYLLELSYNGVSYAEQLKTLTDSQNRTCAHCVCMNGAASQESSEAITNLILEKAGVSIFLQADKYGFPPLLYALVARPYVAKIILDRLSKQFPFTKQYLEDVQKNSAIGLSKSCLKELLPILKLKTPFKDIQVEQTTLQYKLNALGCSIA